MLIYTNLDRLQGLLSIIFKFSRKSGISSVMTKFSYIDKIAISSLKNKYWKKENWLLDISFKFSFI